MKHYELMYIVPLKVGQDDITPIQDKVRAMLVAEGATISKEEVMGKRKLAYPINHVRHGSYVVMELDMDAAALPKVQGWFKLNQEVLRSQIISKKLKTPEELAREQALQEKLQRKQTEAKRAEEQAADTPPKQPVILEELDKKLEKILEEEIVK